MVIRHADDIQRQLAPRELIALVAALVLLLSSTVLLHEVGARFLSYGLFLGERSNVRAFSCLSHIAGTVVGFSLAIATRERMKGVSKTTRLRLWIGFFVLQVVLCISFYLTLTESDEASLGCFIQLLSGASGALFFSACMKFARHLAATSFVKATIAVFAGEAMIVYGLFTILIVHTPMPFVIAAHLALIAGAAGCFFWVTQHNPATLSPFGSDTAPSVQMSSARNDLKRLGRWHITPFVSLWIAICSYGAVFGLLHVIPLGLPATQFSRVVSNLIGMVAASLLLYFSLRKTDMGTAVIWNRVYRLVFPFATLAALLIPFTGGSGFMPSLGFAESATYYFDMTMAVACFTVCKATGVSAPQVFAHAFLARNVGFFIGDFVGMEIHENVPLTNEVFSVLGIAVFLLLCVVTFNIGGEKYAKTAWGVVPKEDPKALFERQLCERCDALAEEFRLTGREREVLKLLAQNKRPKEISDELVVSVATVRTHVQGVYNKLDVHSHDELVRLVRTR